MYIWTGSVWRPDANSVQRTSEGRDMGYGMRFEMEKKNRKL